jgi:hypothetical protein
MLFIRQKTSVLQSKGIISTLHFSIGLEIRLLSIPFGPQTLPQKNKKYPIGPNVKNQYHWLVPNGILRVKSRILYFTIIFFGKMVNSLYQVAPQKKEQRAIIGR